MWRGCRVIATTAAPLLLIGACGGESGSTGGAATTEAVSATSTAAPLGTTPPIITTAPPAADAALPVVVDTDLAADDLVALLYLLSDPAVDVLAVTVSGTGEVTCPRGEEVASALLAVIGHDDVPVACGRSSPLSGNRVFPQEWRSAADGAYGLWFPAVARSSVAEQDAVELLIGAVGTAPEPVTLLTLGALANVAQAFTAEPGLATALAGVVVMGGAVDVPGSVQLDGAAAPLAAEWNLYIDPEATAVVVASGATVTLVTLDATNEVPVTADLIDRLEANDVTDATSIVADLLTGRAPPFLWDPLAAIATARPDLVPRRERLIAVVTEGEDAGRTVERPDDRRCSSPIHPTPTRCSTTWSERSPVRPRRSRWRHRPPSPWSARPP
jgi:pyrimidine-specific ribonucleoside hydrolase